MKTQLKSNYGISIGWDDPSLRAPNGNLSIAPLTLTANGGGNITLIQRVDPVIDPGKTNNIINSIVNHVVPSSSPQNLTMPLNSELQQSYSNAGLLNQNFSSESYRVPVLDGLVFINKSLLENLNLVATEM